MGEEGSAAVAGKFDRGEVRRSGAEADREARARGLRGETLGRDEVLPNMDGSKRIRHAGTGFQTNHITSRGADESPQFGGGCKGLVKRSVDRSGRGDQDEVSH